MQIKNKVFRLQACKVMLKVYEVQYHNYNVTGFFFKLKSNCKSFLVKKILIRLWLTQTVTQSFPVKIADNEKLFLVFHFCSGPIEKTAQRGG